MQPLILQFLSGIRIVRRSRQVAPNELMQPLRLLLFPEVSSDQEYHLSALLREFSSARYTLRYYEPNKKSSLTMHKLDQRSIYELARNPH